jgi:hypothetical protein
VEHPDNFLTINFVYFLLFTISPPVASGFFARETVGMTNLTLPNQTFGKKFGSFSSKLLAD